jgi:putative transposase
MHPLVAAVLLRLPGIDALEGDPQTHPPRRHGRRPFAKVREPNDVWCVDFKGDFAMTNGRRCYPLTVMDAASRFLLACVALDSPNAEHTRKVFVDLFRRYGLPKVIRSDNGEPFASMSKAAGLTCAVRRRGSAAVAAAPFRAV